ncbi:MAG: TetR/AcrR family transcriptional regulator [Salipiger marinus]|uniref:TetR/AcrR family transcriptional regulator n=1 Tax=Salipiger marinus TaxID=555512 RepID=UPI0040597455
MARTTGSHSEITGPRIREAALRLFAKHGYAAVSMRQIAREVGVQVGALYNYTPDKQALLFSLLQGHMDELLAAWEAEPRGADPRAGLESFVRFHIRFNLARPEAIFISYMELRNLEPAPFAAIESLRKTYEQELEAILAQGRDAGVFQLDEPRITAFALIAMLTGVNTWYRADGRLSEPEVASLYWDMTRRAVGA